MKTTIDNNQRVFQIITSTGDQYFCNLSGISDIVLGRSLTPGYFKIRHFWNNQPKNVSKKYLSELFKANGLQLNFHY